MRIGTRIGPQRFNAPLLVQVSTEFPAKLAAPCVGLASHYASVRGRRSTDGLLMSVPFLEFRY